ncbi:GMC oxidoreductase [Karstenula rhodostoma CBS 690.94]|uniref:GMC oxidoreductase n=1 Tax=Karstenula rhodostoma CBS 690.94 TaxID=1392251 RepID=A0A9P4U567_9PLEO|nr:GMC oxidoreductase [Karstenula rhodostoma CBS 690.94]
MGLSTELPAAIEEVDVIVVGGGTTGCVVAARLADADPSLEILVIERGPNNELPTIEYPAAFPANLAPDSKTTYFNVSKPSTHVGNRPLVVPSGGVLGGGSSINFMTYSRAQNQDLDAWDTPGWSSDELLPYTKKSETYHSQYVDGGQGSNQEDEGKNHGSSGPIHVSRGTYSAPKVIDEFMTAAAKLGLQERPDKSDIDSINSMWRIHRFISHEGKRQDAATCYVHPRLRDGKHPNLHVLVETQVARVLFDNQNVRAIGVEVRRNPLFDEEAATKPLRSIRARKMVVLSCGTCATPLILERSGIGEAQVLERAGVSVIVDLPGVGNEYEDHHLLSYGYKSAFTADETGDALLYGRMGSIEDLIKQNHKILGWNAQEVQCKIRPNQEEVDSLGLEFREAWDAEFKDRPEKPLVVLNLIAGNPDMARATGDPSIGTTAFTVYPFSRGSIHITGSTLDDPADFDTGFFAGEKGHLDVRKHVFAYKKQREIMRRMSSYRGECDSHPPFAADSPAACVDLTEALAADVQDIVYSADDDAVLEKWIRDNVGTTWHSLGTCKMQAREKKGVVDAKLGVYGVKGLKVADLSIAPGNVAANTNTTALMIGEKAADIFIEELGLSLT